MKNDPSEIARWKKDSAVRSCYRNIFKPINEEDGITYIYRILQKLWPRDNLKNIPRVWISFVIGTVEVLLNPYIPNIKVSEQIMKPKLRKYEDFVVSFYEI